MNICLYVYMYMYMTIKIDMLCKKKDTTLKKKIHTLKKIPTPKNRPLFKIKLPLNNSIAGVKYMTPQMGEIMNKVLLVYEHGGGPLFWLNILTNIRRSL